MSQKREKYARRLARERVDRWKLRAQAAEHSARVWRRLFLAALAACALLTMQVHAGLEPDKPIPVPEPGPAVQAIPAPTQPPEAPEAAPEATPPWTAVLENCTVTHYCVCERCCGKPPDHPAYGITASGARATPGVTAAVDPAVIPLGAEVLADYGDGVLHHYRAEDTGGAVRGSRIDLCVGSHKEALALGVRTATIYVKEAETT